MVIFTPSGGEVDSLLERARRDIAGLTSTEIVTRIISHNPDAFWAITRRDRFDVNAPKGEGFIAFLMLNEVGVRRLIDGSLDTRNPDIDVITRQSDKPAGIYVWAIHARGINAAAIPLALEKVSTPLYRDAPLFARAVTEDGFRILETLGFRRGAEFENLYAPHLHMYRRAAIGELPSYDGYQLRSNRPRVSVSVAKSIEDLVRAISVRSAVYIAEQQCPYDEEFDGNDFSATHLLGYVGNEPVGCLRIRYFADFAKFERLAVRHEFRRTGVASKIVEAAIDLCRMKGYQKLYAHSQKSLLGFWGRHGFRTFESGRDFVFSDYDYVEVMLDAERHPQAITIGVDPYVIIRPEGRWHIPGILEQSASRGAGRPHERAAS